MEDARGRWKAGRAGLSRAKTFCAVGGPSPHAVLDTDDNEESRWQVRDVAYGIGDRPVPGGDGA